MKRAFLISLPILFVTAFLFFANVSDRLHFVLNSIVYLFINSIFFLIVYQNKIQRWRSILFSTMAFCFVLQFMAYLIEEIGSLFITGDIVYQNKSPFCHLVIHMTLLPMIFKQIIIFPGSLLEGEASIGTMVVLWISTTLLLGRGFCSWFCFFGGLEESISRLSKQQRLILNNKWRYLPWSILLVSSLLAFASCSPFYCSWICPFKAVTEFSPVTSLKSLFQFISFASLFLIFVLVLPFLTKRRSQCSYLCPFGALQSLTNKFSLFTMKFEKNRCKKCLLCTKACPISCLDKEHILQGKMPLSCIKCGGCIDSCPEKAISFHVRGCLPTKNYNLLFLYPAFLILSVMSQGMLEGALYRIFLLLSTGSMLHG